MSEPTLGVLVLSCCFLVANRFAAGPAIVFGITNPALLKKRLLSSGKLCASVGASISVETAMRAHTAGIQLQRRREFAAARRAACSLEPLRFGVGVSYVGETSANRNRECTLQEAFTDAGVGCLLHVRCTFRNKIGSSCHFATKGRCWNRQSASLRHRGSTVLDHLQHRVLKRLNELNPENYFLLSRSSFVMNRLLLAADAQASWIASCALIERSWRISTNLGAACKSKGTIVAFDLIICS